MKLQLSFSEGPRVIARDLNQLQSNLGKFRQPLQRSVREVMAPSIERNFEAGGRPREWKPLDPETIRQRVEQGYGTGPILVRTGRLKRSASAIRRWNVSRGVAETTEFPPSVFYAPFHQFGTRYMPARPFMMIQEEDAEEIEEIFFEWMSEQIRGTM